MADKIIGQGPHFLSTTDRTGPGQSKSPLASGNAGPNRRACEQVVDALRELGRLDRVDEAIVTAALELAAAVDAALGRASLWEQYREALATLREIGNADGDAFADLLRDLSAPVGDAPQP